jgi:hypothetical protein
MHVDMVYNSLISELLNSSYVFVVLAYLGGGREFGGIFRAYYGVGPQSLVPTGTTTHFNFSHYNLIMMACMDINCQHSIQYLMNIHGKTNTNSRPIVGMEEWEGLKLATYFLEFIL